MILHRRIHNVPISFQTLVEVDRRFKGSPPLLDAVQDMKVAVREPSWKRCWLSLSQFFGKKQIRMRWRRS